MFLEAIMILCANDWVILFSGEERFLYLYGDPKINITDYFVKTHAIMARRSPSTTDLAGLSQRQERLQMAEGIKRMQQHSC